MKFRVLYQQIAHNAQSPIRVVEQTTGCAVGWVNRYLDREYVRRLANTSAFLLASSRINCGIPMPPRCFAPASPFLP